MIQFTTPTLTLVAKGVTLNGAVRIWASIEQRGSFGTVETDIEVPYSSVVIDGTSVSVPVTLTQEQTGKFAPGNAQVQLNWIDGVGRRMGTEIGTVKITRNLLDKVVSYG